MDDQYLSSSTTLKQNTSNHVGLQESPRCYCIRFPRFEKIFSLARSTSSRIQHINPKLVLHIHILQVLNFYTLSFSIVLLLLHVYPQCATILLSILISNLLITFQVNLLANTQVPLTNLFILERNHEKCHTTFHNSKHILDTIMHSVGIILPRSTRQYITTFHVHNVIQQLVLILPNLEFNKAFLPHFQRILTLQQTNPTRIRMSHSIQTKFLNHLHRNNVICTTVINNHLAHFTTRLTMSLKQTSPLTSIQCRLTNQYLSSHKTLSFLRLIAMDYNLIHNRKFCTMRTFKISIPFFITSETITTKPTPTYPFLLINRLWFTFNTQFILFQVILLLLPYSITFDFHLQHIFFLESIVIRIFK